MKTLMKSNFLGCKFGYGIAVVLVCLCMMHPIHAIFGLKIKLLYSFSVLYLVALGSYQAKFQIEKAAYLIPSAIVIAGLIGTMISGESHQLLVGLSGGASFIAAYYLATCGFEMKSVVKGLVLFDYILLVGCIIAFLYAYYGGASVGDFINPETKRPIALYLTSFTNSVLGDLPGLDHYIRPAGLFDEPGSLVLFNILVVCLNQVVLKNTVTSYRLLLLGLISFSFMAVIALILFAVVRLCFFSTKLKVNVPKVIFSFVIVVGTLFALSSPISELLGDRIYSEKRGFFPGDNRSGQVVVIITNMNKRIFFSGNHGRPKTFEGQVEANPLTLLYESGVVIWLAYVITLCALLRASFHKNPDIIYSCLVIILLLLQKPYLWSMYWSVFIWATIIVIMRFANSTTLINQSNRHLESEGA